MKINYKRPLMADYQLRFMDNRERFTIVESSTKAGKTTSMIIWLFEQALQGKPYQNFWWVAPVYAQCLIAFNRMQQFITVKNFFTVNRSRLELVLPNKTIIAFKSADNPETLYGSDTYAAVFDEHTRSTREAWYALRSTLTATRGKCKFIGNFRGTANWGHQLALKAQEPDSEYAYFKITAWDAVAAGILSEEEVRQAQKDLPADIFAALYLAEAAKVQNQLISDESIQDMFTNTHADTGEMYITADIAMQGADKFTVWAWNGWRVIDYVIMEKSSGPVVEGTIKAMAEKHKVGRSNIAYDADGLGNFLEGYLQNARPIHNNASPIPISGQKLEFENLKAQIHYEFGKKVNEKGVWLKAYPEQYKEEIIQDFQMVRNRNFGTGGKFALLKKEAIKQYIGRSPDYGEGLAMRAFFDIKPKVKFDMKLNW